MADPLICILSSLYAEQINECLNPFNFPDGTPDFSAATLKAPGVREEYEDVSLGITLGTHYSGGSIRASLRFECQPNYVLHFEQPGGKLVEAQNPLFHVFRCDSSTGFRFDKVNFGEPRCKLLACMISIISHQLLTYSTCVNSGIRLCSNLEHIDNGRVDYPNRRPGTTATYTCNPDFHISGTRTRTCGDNGEWSGEEPTCERKNQKLHNIIVVTE